MVDSRRTVLTILFAFSALILPLNAQSELDVAMRFFKQGGAYCFRLAPEGESLSDETSWTVMVLTGAANSKNEFRIRTMDPGGTGVSGTPLKNIGLSITSIWRRDRLRDEFFEQFAAGITARTVRARIVTLSPPKLAEMNPRGRAELYLKFADGGSRVDFRKSPDLTADQFLAYQTYLPD